MIIIMIIIIIIIMIIKSLFILGFWSSCEANFSEFDTHTAQ